MNRSKFQKKRLRRVPPIADPQEKDWLGAEAHVPHHDRPIDWYTSLRTEGAGFNSLALTLSFLGGAVLGGLLISLADRHCKS